MRSEKEIRKRIKRWQGYHNPEMDDVEKELKWVLKGPHRFTRNEWEKLVNLERAHAESLAKSNKCTRRLIKISKPRYSIIEIENVITQLKLEEDWSLDPVKVIPIEIVRIAYEDLIQFLKDERKVKAAQKWMLKSMEEILDGKQNTK